MTRSSTTLLALLATSAAAASLAGCKLDNRPLLARRDAPPADVAYLPPSPDAYLPLVADLPPARPVPVAYAGPQRAYYYPERAYRMDRAWYDEAPDYGFAYGDEEPWAWTGDEGMMFAEPISDGYRYYYYEPGEAYPYYVRDPDYGYAYGDDGALVALFSAAGALLGPELYPRYSDVAGRYRSRAYDMNRAYYSAPRVPIQESVWREQAPRFTADRDRWYRAAETQAPWRDYRERYQSDGGWERQRQIVASAPAPQRWTDSRASNDQLREQALAEARRGERGEGRAWREAARDQREQSQAIRQQAHQEAQAQARLEREQVKAERRQADEARAQAFRQAREESDRREREAHGRRERQQQVARAAAEQGRNAAWRGDDNRQAPAQQHEQKGGGDHENRGHGNGDHGGGNGGDRGHGGGHGKGK